MLNSELLFTGNNTGSNWNLRIEDGMVVFRLKEEHFNYTTIKKIIYFINCIHKKYKKNIPISFEFGKIYFIDKLVYTLFECICDELIRKWGQDIYVQFENKDSIWTAGIKSSPLLLLTTGEKKHREKFKEKFNKELYQSHYRRVVRGAGVEPPDYLSVIMTELEMFLKTFQVTDNCRNEISEVIVELIGNADEHTGADCLLDLDVSPGYIKKDTNEKYYGINLAIINFSPKLLGDGIKEKIAVPENLDNRHLSVLQAYNKHKEHFSGDYQERDFFNIASFQHRISGRDNNNYTGGTGLTKLIHSLESKSDAHRCYVISGNRGLLFRKEFLEYNKENWIGFNKEKDFLTAIPELSNIEQIPIFFPGTAYNLNFVMKEDENGE